MSRPPNPAIRSRLLNQALAYTVSNGFWDLSLRPLAKALKTNARMLIYHFGSREELLKEILLALRRTEGARIEAWWRSRRRPPSLTEFLHWYWRRMSSPRAVPAIRLVFELYALALRYPAEFPGVLEVPVSYWDGLARRSRPASKTPAITATLLLAATRGLLLDLAATGDRVRVGRALKTLIRLIDSEVHS